jgi:hypothetical protein
MRSGKPQRYPDTVQILTGEDERLILTLPFVLTEFTGVSLPPINVRSARAPDQHGSTVIDLVFQDRPVTMSLNVRGDCPEVLWARQRLLENYLTPAKGSMRLRVLWGPGNYYELREVYFDSGLDIGIGDGSDPRNRQMPFRLVAHNPFWHGPEETNSDTSGGGAWNPTLTCQNEGNWYAYPTVSLTGPMDAGAQLEFDPAGGVVVISDAIPSGETWVVTTGFGERYVTDAAGDYVGLGEDTTLKLCYFTVDPIAADGNNTIELTAAGTTVATQLSIAWNNLWLGLGLDSDEV